MPIRCAAASRGTYVPDVNVCEPWCSACVCWAARSSARASSVVRDILCLLLSSQHSTPLVSLSVLLKHAEAEWGYLARVLPLPADETRTQAESTRSRQLAR